MRLLGKVISDYNDVRKDAEIPVTANTSDGALLVTVVHDHGHDALHNDLSSIFTGSSLGPVETEPKSATYCGVGIRTYPVKRN